MSQYPYGQYGAQYSATTPAAAAYGAQAQGYGAYGYGGQQAQYYQNPYAAYGSGSSYSQMGYGQTGASAAPSQTSSLWMGDLEPYWDEAYVQGLFGNNPEISHARVIKDKTTGKPSGYGFIYFNNPAAAQRALETYNGQPIPESGKTYKLNWAAHGMGKNAIQSGASGFATRPPTASGATMGALGMGGGTYPPPSMTAATPYQSGPLPRPSPGAETLAVFVGDLSPDVTDVFLLTTFQYYYPSAYTAKIVKDQTSLLSKGYGFVYFNDETEKNRALTEMQGYQLSYRPIKLNAATKKKDTYPVPGAQSPYQSQGYSQYSQGYSQGSQGYSQGYSQPEVQQPPAPTFPPARPSFPSQLSQQVSQNSQAAQATSPSASQAYSQPSQTYSQPSQTYSQPSQTYSQPSQSWQENSERPERLGAADPNNTTVFLGGIDGSITHEQIKTYFAPFGEITNVKIPIGKGCAFVEFTTHESAKKILDSMPSPIYMGHCAVRLSWGRPSVKLNADGEIQTPVKAVPPTIPGFKPPQPSDSSDGSAQYDPEQDSEKSEKSEIPDLGEYKLEEEDEIPEISENSRRPEAEDEKPAKKPKQEEVSEIPEIEEIEEIEEEEEEEEKPKPKKKSKAKSKAKPKPKKRSKNVKVTDASDSD
eukprot:TRINITY_DN1204_c0_g1_i1.p1 TRINITY_DN1204_c0_g1~~TRINITY_DN1204_c0_g1_i1.p1  ORF type:complete len:645 (+),score=199.01 TRINITY_DN1204_c0_g1_i1:2284-4218(+)